MPASLFPLRVSGSPASLPDSVCRPALRRPLETYLHPDSQLPGVGLPPGLLVFGINPADFLSPLNLGGEAVTDVGGDGKATVVLGDVEPLSAHRTLGFARGDGNGCREGK